MHRIILGIVFWGLTAGLAWGDSLLDRTSGSPSKDEKGPHSSDGGEKDPSSKSKTQGNNAHNPESDTAYKSQAEKGSAGKALQERHQKTADLANSAEGTPSATMGAIKSGGAGAIGKMGAGASGLSSGLAGAAGGMGAKLKGLASSAGGMAALGGMGALAGLGGIGALVGGASLLKLLKGKVSKGICFTACNRAACRSSRIRAMCLSKCSANPDTIKNCEAMGD